MPRTVSRERYRELRAELAAELDAAIAAAPAAARRATATDLALRHNVRTLRGEYPAPLLWRMLVRYLF